MVTNIKQRGKLKSGGKLLWGHIFFSFRENLLFLELYGPQLRTSFPPPTPYRGGGWQSLLRVGLAPPLNQARGGRGQSYIKFTAP